MSNDSAETRGDTDVTATADKQINPKQENDFPVHATTPTVRPWTADFLLPSISFRDPKRT